MNILQTSILHLMVLTSKIFINQYVFNARNLTLIKDENISKFSHALYIFLFSLASRVEKLDILMSRGCVDFQMLSFA